VYSEDSFYNTIAYAYSHGQMKYLSKILLEDYMSRKLLDGILVFGDEKIFNVADEFDLGDEYRKKIFHI